MVVEYMLYLNCVGMEIYLRNGVLNFVVIIIFVKCSRFKSCDVNFYVM